MTKPSSQPRPPTTCPLCAAQDSTQIDGLNSDRLRAEYRRAYAVNIPEPPATRIDLFRCAACDLRYFNPSYCGDEAFYASLQHIDWYYREDKPEYEIARRHIRPSDRVLEIGAGKAAFANGLACAAYVGLEMSPKAIHAAQMRSIALLHESIEIYSARAKAAHDVVCSFQVLEHVHNPRSFIQAARNCLRPGGRLILAVPSENSFAAISYWDVLNMPPHHVTRWSDRCLGAVASLFDLKLISIEHEPLEDRHARLFARYAAEYAIARKLGHQPTLLDPYMRRRWLRIASQLTASFMKHAFLRPELRPVGHSVVAVYELS